MADREEWVTCKVAEEDNGFGLRASTDGDGLSVIKGSIQEDLKEMELVEDSVKQDHGEWDPIAGSKAMSTLGLATRCGGLGDSVSAGAGAGDGETPVHNALSRLALTLFNEAVVLIGDTVAASPAPLVTSFGLTAQTTLDIPEVVVLMVQTVADGVYPIPCTILDGVCTPVMQPPSAPQAGGIVYGGICLRFAEDVDLGNAVNFLLRKDQTDHQFWLKGLMAHSMELDLSAGNLPKMTFQTKLNGWEDAAEILEPIPPPPTAPHMAAGIRLAQFGTATYNANQKLTVKGECKLQVSRPLDPDPDPWHEQGYSGYTDNGKETAFSFSPVLPYTRSYRDNFGQDAGVNYHMLFASSRLPGRGICGYAQRLTQRTFPKPAEHNGMLRVQPTFALKGGYVKPGVVMTIF